MAAGHWQFLTSRDSSRAEQAATGSNSRADQAAAERSRQQSGADNSRVEQASEEDFGCLRERETDLMNRLIFFGQQVLW